MTYWPVRTEMVIDVSGLPVDDGLLVRYLESLVDYMENYALRIRPLLDVSEVSVMMVMIMSRLYKAYIC